MNVAHLVNTIAELSTDEYQEQGMALPFNQTDISKKDKEMLRAGTVIPWYDRGCQRKNCSCHTANQKKICWMAGFKDANGDWFSQEFQTYETYPVE